MGARTIATALFVRLMVVKQGSEGLGDARAGGIGLVSSAPLLRAVGDGVGAARAVERFVFRLGYRERSMTLALREGFVTDEFIDLARTDERTTEQERRLDVLKQEMAERVMTRRRRRSGGATAGSGEPGSLRHSASGRHTRTAVAARRAGGSHRGSDRRPSDFQDSG